MKKDKIVCLLKPFIDVDECNCCGIISKQLIPYLLNIKLLW